MALRSVYATSPVVVNPFPTPVELRPAYAHEVSEQALTLFIKLRSLSERVGYAFVNYLSRLAEMFDHKERATRYALAELQEAGWIERRHTRKGGRSKLFFRPLVFLIKPGKAPFSPPVVAVCPAVSSPSSLQVAPPAPIKKTPGGREGKEKTTTDLRAIGPSVSQPVVVAPPVDSQELARLTAEMARLGIPLSDCRALTRLGGPERIRKALAVYRQANREKIRNTRLWLIAAIQNAWEPAAAPEPAPVRTVRPFWLQKPPQDVPRGEEWEEMRRRLHPERTASPGPCDGPRAAP